MIDPITITCERDALRHVLSLAKERWAAINREPGHPSTVLYRHAIVHVQEALTMAREIERTPSEVVHQQDSPDMDTIFFPR